jgi:site-specific recombinase XerC
MSKYSIGRRRGRLELIYHDESGKRHRHSLGTSDARQAELLAPEIFGELAKPRGKTVVELWAAYVIDMEGRAVATTMKHTWKALKERFGHLRGDQISIESCRAHTRARRGAGIQDGTIHTELGHLRMVLLWAEKHGHLAKGSASHIERPAKPKSRTRHLARGDLQRLLVATPFPHVRTFMALAYGTAARTNALLGLTWDRCDFDTGLIDLVDPTIKVPHKGRAVVPMTATVEDALKQALKSALTD